MRPLITMLQRSRADVRGRLRLKTKNISTFAVLTALAALGAVPAGAAEEEGVALAIIYDTSGSMKELVRDNNGQQAAKYLIANRALVAITRQLQAFATNTASGAPRKIYA